VRGGGKHGAGGGGFVFLEHLREGVLLYKKSLLYPVMGLFVACYGWSSERTLYFK